MFVVEVDVVKQWTDRGGTDWVKVGILGASLVGEEVVEVDVKPSDLIQLNQTLVQTTAHVHEVESHSHDDS